MNNKKKKILLVEDDKYYRRAYKDGLEHEGFVVILANDGKEGLKKMQSENPDLVLLDLLMPSMGGFEFLEKTKVKEGSTGVPIVILSNLGQDSDVEKSKILGSIDYLIKANITMKEVIDKIKFHLATSK